MIEKIRAFVDNVILPYVFRVSEDPIRFEELMQANKVHIDGMPVDANLLGYRMKLGRMYIVFIAFMHLFILPLTVIFHSVLIHIDCHLLIIVAVLFTALFFASFTLFKEYLVELKTIRRIKDGWKLHFPHFSYAKHSREVATFYKEALAKDIHHRDLSRFIIDKIVGVEV
ncbi:MAG: hypothetical protein U9P71_01150 [Campylobacterota bacterium]|nr:hypothetical protein [Campylobacterota bacterium]